MYVHGHPGRRKSTELQDLRDVQRASVGVGSRKYSAIRPQAAQAQRHFP